MIFNNQSTGIFLMCLGASCSIFLYGKYRCDLPEYFDVLQTKLHLWDLDGWSLVHLLFYMLQGYLYPNSFYFSMSMGILWELFEQFYGKNPPEFLRGFGHCAKTDPDDTDTKLWWYGKISDLIMNGSGFLIGLYLTK